MMNSESQAEKSLQRFLYTFKDNGTYFVRNSQVATSEHYEKLNQLFKDVSSEVIIKKITNSVTSGMPLCREMGLFALAVCTSHQKDGLSTLAYNCVPDLCQDAQSILQFVKFCEDLRKNFSGKGWGRARKRSIQKWYQNKRPYDVAFGVTSCSALNHWSHKDVLKLSHIKASNSLCFEMLCTYIIQGYNRMNEKYEEQLADNHGDDMDQLMKFFEDIQKLKTSDNTDAVTQIVGEHNLTVHHLPCKWHNNKNIWKCLLHNVPLSTLIGNLMRLHKIRVIHNNNLWSKMMLERLMDEDEIKKSNIHPFMFFLACYRYLEEDNMKMKRLNMMYPLMEHDTDYISPSKWIPDPEIASALHFAFYTSIQNVKRINRRICVAVSALADTENISNKIFISCSMVAAAMCLLFHKVETNTTVKVFAKKLETVTIQDDDVIESVQTTIRKAASSGADCALPIIKAKRDSEDFDAFVVITDGKNMKVGKTSPVKALQQYKQSSKISAKLVVLSLKSIEIDVGSDSNILTIYGFNEHVLTLINKFLSDEF